MFRTYLSTLTRTFFFAHSTAKLAAMCFTATWRKFLSTADIRSRNDRVLTSFRSIIRGLRLCPNMDQKIRSQSITIEREVANLGYVDDLQMPTTENVSEHNTTDEKECRRTLALMLDTKTMLPPPWGIIFRAASRAVKKAPWTLISYNRFMRSKG